MSGEMIPGVRRMWDADGNLIVGDAEAAARERAERIANARQRLAQAEAETPGGVSRYHARQSKLSAAARRERRRFELLVLGGSVDGIDSDPDVDPAVRRAALLRDSWRHKHEGTPETHEAASKTHQGPLAALYNNGSISIDQLACAVEIAEVANMIEADVAMRTQNLDRDPVDIQRAPPNLIEGLRRVRLYRAYDHWRRLIATPKRAVLDMIIGEPVGFTIVAKRYRMHNRRAKRILIDALDLWPDCVDWAEAMIDRADLDAAHAELS